MARRFRVGMVVSEMVASQAMVQKNARSDHMVNTAREEHPLIIQLAGANPEIMGEAARINEDLGAAALDINMGCPQPKIVKNGAGAALMRDEILAGRLIEAVVKAVRIPVTLKIRLGWDPAHLNAARIAGIAESCGVALISVHGRTRTQIFSGQADWEAIRPVKAAVSIPVIANGDIRTPGDAMECLQVSGADGIMVGRGALGRPWIFQQIRHFLETGHETPAPALPEQYQIVTEHLRHLWEFYGPRVGVWISRKHLAWYTKGLRGGALLRKAANDAASVDEISDLTRSFYEDLLDQDARHGVDVERPE